MGTPWLPEVPGDPAGMRALAASLRGYAARAAGIADSVEAALAATTFEGPAAGPLREEQRSSTQTFRRAAEELQELARLLETSAAEVEAAQRERERRLAEMWAEWRAQNEVVPGGAR
jgi:uncharacterized protein YukE